MEQIVDELIAQGYEVTGSDSMIQVKLGGLSGKAGIRKAPTLLKQLCFY
ncbi:hypothetical protein [Vibrio sp. SCSIO 43145]|nr:hypothetical protein [Vibrio sp. SCSIO 43145]